uniref:Uncharacterized protein n=1 Tax=Tanacetum cinerariifolium TaxID=118510 RepID=A0A6L2LF98_TANCI|nr:hypothetical protein [Tanacetum cinerariifolium]
MYTWCPWLYLINNKGTKHKVWLKKVGNKMVFINLLNNTVLLVLFDDSGIALCLENVPSMPLNQDLPFVRGLHDKDKRMEQECDWVNHDEHDNEERCFYAPILAYVSDRKGLERVMALRESGDDY